MVQGSNFDSSFFLSDRGPLAKRLIGFRERLQQQQMAVAVEKALATDGSLVVEAGTGTGKTLAYLVPALLSRKRIIISTGTRNLQEQLFFTDLPLVKDALGIAFSAAMLKGRSNYLCPHRLELNLHTGRGWGEQFYNQLILVRQWSSRTSTGDIAEMAEIEERSPVWPSVTSTVDNCLGQDCPRIEDCPLYRARARANEADVIVVNHHLLFADLLLKEEGLGQVLPAADGIILDEAHQLPEIATRFFGTTLSSRQLIDLARDSIKEQLLIGRDDPELILCAERFEESCTSLLERLGTAGVNVVWAEIWQQSHLREAIADVDRQLSQLTGALGIVSVRSKGLQSCHQRASRVEELFALLAGEAAIDRDCVHWLETDARRFVIHLSPLTIADQFRSIMGEKGCSWIFTSATLAVGDRFDHFAQTMGIDDECDRLKLDSPFNYREQALFYIPADLPDPGDSSFTATVVKRALPLIEMCGGRTFFLFTSHRALDEAAEILRGDKRFSFFVQGSMPKFELLGRFLQTERSVLLATSSFWEGVDVRGAKLSCVIIDKLPFMSPGDPVVAARLAAIDQDGGSGFHQYLLPLAALTLRQGFGRLIRDESDSGIFMLGDQRVLTRSYGKKLLANLPEMEMTRELAVVKKFIEAALPPVRG